MSCYVPPAAYRSRHPPWFRRGSVRVRVRVWVWVWVRSLFGLGLGLGLGLGSWSRSGFTAMLIKKVQAIPERVGRARSRLTGGLCAARSGVCCTPPPSRWRFEPLWQLGLFGFGACADEWGGGALSFKKKYFYQMWVWCADEWGGGGGVGTTVAELLCACWVVGARC